MKTYTAAALLALLSTAYAGRGGVKPMPQTTKVETFKWKHPFDPERMAGFTAACEATKAFPAREYTLHDLPSKPPKGLAPWQPGLKAFFTGREYPGGWGGWDKHLHDRSIVLMEYADMPLKVREWIEEQERTDGAGKGLFGVFEKPEGEEEIESTVTFGEEVDREADAKRVVTFAPGAIYEILPLWVAEGSDCEADLTDLSKYQPDNADGAVVAWPSKTMPTKDKVISVSITANVLAKAEGAAAEEKPAEEKAGKDEL